MPNKEQILQDIDVQGSKTSTKDTKSNTLFVDKGNLYSQYIFASASISKIDVNQVMTAVDVVVNELKPAVPSRPKEFISRDSYNLLLSQSVELNSTISQLRQDVITQSNRITELEDLAETEINERTAIEQTNEVLLNQLEALSETVENFSDQISNALQKSVEESIFRNSLEAQNQGFKAQISGLISQIDSLNAIITGLYAQLGAVLVEKDVQQAAAEAAATNEFSWNVNAVVFTTLDAKAVVKKVNNEDTKFYFWASFDDTDMGSSASGNWSSYRWEAGKGFRIKNYNRVAMEVRIEYFYPTCRNGAWNNGHQKWFKFNPDTSVYNLSPEQDITLAALITPAGVWDDPQCGYCDYYGTDIRIDQNGGIPSDFEIFGNNPKNPSHIKITVKNTVNKSEVSAKITAGMQTLNRD